MSFSRRLVDAFALACELHSEQRRKGTDVPYITHLMAVAALVGEYGGDEEQVIAALLHDAAEDQGGTATLERVRAEFGDRVAAYVEGCSDTFASPKPPWKERKTAFLQTLASREPGLKLIIAADKLHNARSIARDLDACGNDVWQRFTGGREGTLWYYAEAVRALSSSWTSPILREVADVVDKLHRKAQALSNEQE